MAKLHNHSEYYNPNFRFPKEVFKDIKNFEGRFKISIYGRLMSINGKKRNSYIVKTSLDQTGYYCTQLRKVPLYRRIRIHTLVAETFFEKPKGNNICVNHKDGNKLNNHISNLEWVTRTENCRHAARTGLMARGQTHWQSKLTNKDVIKIAFLFFIGYTNIEIGKMFNVHRRTICDIRMGATWSHITQIFPVSSLAQTRC